MSRHEARRAAEAEALSDTPDQNQQQKQATAKEEKLPPQWEKVQGAIWLIGLAILFWQGWIFPGILVLVAISGLTQAAMLYYIRQQEEQATLTTAREVFLPENCPNCGGPVNAASVKWTGRTTAACPFCGSTIKAHEKAIESRVPS